MKSRLMMFAILALAGITLVLLSPAMLPAAWSKTDMTTMASHDDDDDDGDIPESVVRRGLAIAPVPLNYPRRSRSLVGLGSYIVNAQGGCSDCHTNPSYLPGGDPHLGQPEMINAPCYLSGGQAFGPFISRNLTPNALGLPAGLTLGGFIHIIRTGEDDEPPVVPPGHDLLQVMPWPVYGKMATRDLHAVYEFLKAIPPRATCH
ncbi:MAG: cytochrome C [bacterium]